MSLARFIEELAQNGRVRVGHPALADVGDLAAAESVLRRVDAVVRADAPATPPPYDPIAATWAAAVTYRACQCLAHRDVAAEIVADWLGGTCPSAVGPGTCYSVDLTFRFLRDLTAMARGLAEGDPLVAALLRLAVDWPLSSVGVRNVSPVDVSPFIDDPSLRRTYADRVIAAGDVSRLDDPRVVAAVRESVGGWPGLAPREFGHALAATEGSAHE